jgi:copper(I)-binding protein
MHILRTALVAMLLNATALAQPAPTAADATVSDAAGKIELVTGDKPVENLTVAAYGALTLKAGGTFLRLSDLKRELKAGESITVTMMTDGGVAIAATAVVK